MIWSEFTLNNFILLSKKQLINNNLFINKMKKERNIIKLLPNIEYNITKVNINNKLINNLASSKWVDNNGVMNNINILDINIKIKWNGNIIYLKTTHEKYNKILKRLNFFIKMINHIINNSNKKIIIYLILTKLKKKCIHSQDIGAIHINSGYSHTLKNIIFIWREEEF